MKLYEIEAEMENLIDQQTGEIADIEKFEELNLEREVKIENTGLWIKNIKAEVKAIKEEEENLTQRRKTLETKQQRLTEYLQTALKGAEFKTPKLAIKYRKSEKIEIEDNEKLIKYLKENKKTEYIKVEEKIRKDELKKLIQKTEIPYVKIIKNQNIQIK